MQSILYLHSLLRYFILFFAIIVVVQSLAGMIGKRKFKTINKQAALALLIFTDLQLVLGLVLYYTNVIGTGMLQTPGLMKNAYTRFYAMEHAVSMIVAVILVHVGYSVTKRNMDDDRRFRKLFWCIFISLGIFVAMIPWQGRQGGVGKPNIPHMTM